MAAPEFYRNSVEEVERVARVAFTRGETTPPRGPAGQGDKVTK